MDWFVSRAFTSEKHCEETTVSLWHVMLLHLHSRQCVCFLEMIKTLSMFPPSTIDWLFMRTTVYSLMLSAKVGTHTVASTDVRSLQIFTSSFVFMFTVSRALLRAPAGEEFVSLCCFAPASAVAVYGLIKNHPKTLLKWSWAKAVRDCRHLECVHLDA